MLYKQQTWTLSQGKMQNWINTSIEINVNIFCDLFLFIYNIISEFFYHHTQVVCFTHWAEVMMISWEELLSNKLVLNEEY